MKGKNIWLHFIKICTHKHYVRKYCWKAGLHWQGITHDLSKFSPIEFWESVRYYQGNRSPIDACKEDKGYSNAWLHHKGRNPHHYEYWQDNFDKGGEPLLMPCKYAVEMLCDYLGAGHAYYGKSFTYRKEYEWWLDKKKKSLAMHPAIIKFIDKVLSDMAVTNGYYFSKSYVQNCYYQSVAEWSEERKLNVK